MASTYADTREQNAHSESDEEKTTMTGKNHNSSHAMTTLRLLALFNMERICQHFTR